MAVRKQQSLHAFCKVLLPPSAPFSQSRTYQAGNTSSAARFSCCNFFSQFDSQIVHGFVIRKSPSTNASICVRRKQSIASCGLQTIGSLSLKEVLSTTGTPVWCSTSLINFQ